MRSGIPSPRISFRTAAICVPCRNCSGTRRCRRRKSIPRLRARGCLRSTMPRIRAPARNDRLTGADQMTVEPDIAAPPLIETRRGVPLGYAFAAAGALLFSTKAIIVKLAYDMNVAPDTLLALRMGFSLPCYLAIGFVAIQVRQRKGLAIPPLQPAISAMLIGVLGMWFASYSDFLGLQYISAQFERLILFTYPLFVVIFGALFFGQRIRLTTTLGLGVSYAGLALIFTEHF